MAGNKALEKYKESKIPKKGKGKVTVEIPIYEYPNTQSKIIGKIKKNQEITWISKSICDEREWIRSDKKNNYGYIVGYETPDKCNLDIGNIKEDKSEPKKEYGINTKEEIKPLTKEEVELGNEALKEILNDEEEEWNKNSKYDNNESKTDISTEMEENNKSGFLELNNDENKIIRLDEEALSDYFFDDDISKLDVLKRENDKLMNEIICKVGKDSNKKQNKNKKEKKSTNDNDNDNDTEKDIPFSEIVPTMFDGFEKDDKARIKKILNDERTKELLYQINEESQKKIEENLKEENDKKKDKKDNDKKNKKEDKQKGKFKLRGEIYPLDYSGKLADRKTVLKRVKKANGIPEDAEPIRIEYNKKIGKKYQSGFNLVYEVIENGKKVERKIRDDNEGHLYDDNYYLPPHFNDYISDKHYYYIWENPDDN